MQAFIRKWAGPRFVERPAPKTLEQLERDQFRRERFRDGVQAAAWLSFVAFCGVLLLVIGGFSPLAFVALALIVAISAFSSMAQ